MDIRSVSEYSASAIKTNLCSEYFGNFSSQMFYKNLFVQSVTKYKPQ